ncbi:MAG: carbamoyltransferase HypF, partial [Acinetobacter sp.]|nr:carbamoyltransferase HypF [Acinetobacter sp.]
MTSSQKTQTNICCWAIRVRGTVQGVGFRPTVFKLAHQIGITGSVLNDGDGVHIEAFGEQNALADFVLAIENNSPPLAHIEEISHTTLTPLPDAIPAVFTISKSQSSEAKTNVSADAATCAACIEDIFSPFSRRFRYPFTNCTHCGPRLSIVKSIPYDRAMTSMAKFPMCSDCQKEYEDPEDRRFHAQPNACHVCGPRAWLERCDGKALCIESMTHLDDVDATATLIQRGEIVAIKGIGGFHLACDASNEKAVAELRQRKLRFHKPFALMGRDLSIIKQYCQVSADE